MTPPEIYSALSTAYPHHIASSVCCTNKDCTKRGYCIDKQTHPVLDFDGIKEDYYHGTAGQTPASVDAVCIGGQKDHLCFVELKGWNLYITHLSQQTKTPEATAAHYNLSGKLFDSQDLCKKITGDSDLFAHIPTAFLLVTDIDVNSHGFEYFADAMYKLSETSSSDIYSQCLSQAAKTLDSEIHIEHYYVYCKDFERIINKL